MSEESANKQILMTVELVSNNNDLPKETVFSAIERALEAATKKRNPLDIDAHVIIDPNTGDYETFRRWTVVDPEVELKENEEFEFVEDKHLTLEQAKAIDPEMELGSTREEAMDSVPFGRIVAQIAKQVILHELRKAERNQLAATYREKIGQLVSGTVKKISRDIIVLDLGNNAEAIIPRSEMMPRETARMNDRMRAYLLNIKEDAKGPQLIASRTAPDMLRELFKIEVPEVGEEIIEIKAVARDPGARSKIAVKTNDGRIDPIGACIGMRGARVQAVSNELSGERVDIVLWDDDPVQFVIKAMVPAEVSSIVVDEDNHAMDIAFHESQLSQAIGRGGQNVRLAAELSGWKLNVMSEEDAEKKSQEDGSTIKTKFMEQLDIDDDMAGLLAGEGFRTLEEIAFVPTQELLNIEGFDEDIVTELRSRAKDTIKKLSTKTPADDLVQLDGMNDELAQQLADKDIITQEDLADQSVDELIELVSLTEEKAAELIMKAREPWFANADKE